MVSREISRIFDKGVLMPDNRMIRDSFTITKQRRGGKMALETITGYTGTEDAKQYATAIKERVTNGAHLTEEHAPATPQATVLPAR